MPSVWFALALLGLDAALVAGTQRLPDLALAPPAAGAAPDLAADHGWAYCQTWLRGRDVTPVTVAITYLEPGSDAAVSPGEIRSWLGDIDPVAVDVYKLAHSDGSRRVSLEVGRSKWPVWEQVAAGVQGEEVCGLVRAALRARGIGRPRPAPGAGKPGQHDFEFIYARRPRLYQSIEWVGTLDQVLASEVLGELQAWLLGAPGEAS